MTEYRRNSGSRSGRRSAPGGRQSRDRLSAVKSARSSGSRRGGNHRKKNGPDITKILMYGIAAVILLIVIFLVVKMVGSRPASGDTTSEPETELEKEVTVDGVVITGMLREEAMETIVDHIDWGMKVVYDDKEAEVPNLMEAKVDELLEEIYHGEPKETYELDTDGLSEAITAAVDTIADDWDVKPRNGGISEFDSESGSFKFAEGTVGIVIDREKMAADMLENAMTIPYTKPRRLMNQFPMKEADGSTKMHDPAAPTKNPETCHCQISWKRLIDATAPDRTTMATDMTIRVSYFESSLPARGVTSVVPMK